MNVGCGGIRGGGGAVWWVHVMSGSDVGGEPFALNLNLFWFALRSSRSMIDETRSFSAAVGAQLLRKPNLLNRKRSRACRGASDTCVDTRCIGISTLPLDLDEGCIGTSAGTVTGTSASNLVETVFAGLQSSYRRARVRGSWTRHETRKFAVWKLQ
eukprot:5919363-Pleurochrysis_carterae.AAC.3